jgi:predicted aldo/keto reductase-like oxidoreductase
MAISRREFLETTALTGAVAATSRAAENELPKRVLGRTGAKVSILAFGSGSRFLMYKQEDEALAAITRALDLGITYVDTAFSYGKGLSEERVGKALKGRRKDIFLATKVPDRKGDDAMRTIEGSLKRLQTDHVDLLHIHSLESDEDLKKIEAPDGVLKVLYKLRDQKVARAIGITCHADPAALKTALEHNDFDCTQMALNAALAGMGSSGGGFAMNPMPQASFETLALPVAQKKKMGVIAMKVFAQEHLNDKAPVDQLVRYSMSLPVAAAVIGMPKLEYIEKNVEIARNFRPLSPMEMRMLSRRLSMQHKAAIDRFFAHHVDA